MTRAGQPDFWQRRPARRAPPPIERRVHIAIADLLRVACKPGWFWSHVPSGELRTKETGALLLRLGLRAGMFDLLFIGPNGQHYWMEIKRDHRAPLTEGQKQFAEMLHHCGVPHRVARSYDQAVTTLKEWGVL
jgi:hypothetical protein